MQIKKIFDTITIADAAADPHRVITEFCNLINGRKIIIYGAALIGEVLFQCLSELDIKISYIVDRDAKRIGNISGFAVELPEALNKIADVSANYVYIYATSERTAYAVHEDLEKLGLSFEVIFNGQKVADCLRSAICAVRHLNGKDVSHAYCGDCSILDSTCPVLRCRAKDEDGVLVNDTGSKHTVTIGYALSNICTLNCKFCFESVPLYKKNERYFVETAAVINDIKRLAGASGYLTFVEFIGGEPFLHKGLPEIIRYCLSVSNIAYIHVFTNGTVTPSEDLLDALKNERASVYVSNYSGFLTAEQDERVEQIKQLLQENGILYMHGGEKKWFDMSNYEYHFETEGDLMERYANCQTHHCNRLHDGVLYVCPHHYAGVKLGKFQEANTVHIHDLNDDELGKELESFKKISFAEACKYCDMPNAPLIMAGD